MTTERCQDAALHSNPTGDKNISVQNTDKWLTADNIKAKRTERDSEGAWEKALFFSCEEWLVLVQVALIYSTVKHQCCWLFLQPYLCVVQSYTNWKYQSVLQVEMCSGVCGLCWVLYGESFTMKMASVSKGGLNNLLRTLHLCFCVRSLVSIKWSKCNMTKVLFPSPALMRGCVDWLVEING